MSEGKIPQNTLLVVAGISFFLALLKFAAYMITGSAIVLASFLDSLFDSFTSLINRFINKKSLEAADKEHPFGHGGFEVISSLIQVLLMVFLAVSLFRESLRKLLNQEVVTLDEVTFGLGLGVLVFSALAGGGIHLFFASQVKKMTIQGLRSLTMLTDQAHYSGDAVTNALSALGLGIVFWSQWWFLDALFGCLAALMLMRVAYPIIRKTINDIVQSEAPRPLQESIVGIVLRVDGQIGGVRQFRCRHFGPSLFVDFHMVVDDRLHLRDANGLSNRVIEAIKREYPQADVLIHLAPQEIGKARS